MGLPLKKRFLFLVTLLLFIFSCTAFSEDKSDQEKKDLEFPQWALYVRRTEIVTLGSLPFTTLGVTMGMGAYKYFSGQTDTFPNPFDKNSAYSKDDIKTIVGISVSISVVIGIVDLIVTIVKNNNRAKQLDRLMDTSSVIVVVPATEEQLKNFGKSVPENDDSAEGGE